MAYKLVSPEVIEHLDKLIDVARDQFRCDDCEICDEYITVQNVVDWMNGEL